MTSPRICFCEAMMRRCPRLRKLHAPAASGKFALQNRNDAKLGFAGHADKTEGKT
jgi:hypothetical protein